MFRVVSTLHKLLSAKTKRVVVHQEAAYLGCYAKIWVLFLRRFPLNRPTRVVAQRANERVLFAMRKTRMRNLLT